ncbi:MAG: hypothetical protein PHV06_09815, partial [bacterium]|nr:hypothetical protein [bacterium]
TFGFKYLSAQDGTLERDGWFAQLAYLIPVSANGASLEPVIRVGSLDFNLPPVPDDSLTWDRRETTVALLTTFTKGVMVKTEYYMNDENTGNGKVDNDELLIQLEIKF